MGSTLLMSVGLLRRGKAPAEFNASVVPSSGAEGPARDTWWGARVSHTFSSPPSITKREHRSSRSHPS